MDLDYAESVEKYFDTYCKKIIKNEAIYMQKNEQEIKRNLTYLSDLGDCEEKLITTDEYSFDCHRYKVLGHEVEVKHTEIGEALGSYPDLKRDIILLAYFFDLPDREIADILKISRSSVQYHRTKTLQKLKERLEKKIEKQ